LRPFEALIGGGKRVSRYQSSAMPGAFSEWRPKCELAKAKYSGKRYATDRYLSRGQWSMPPLFPVARCWDCYQFSAPHMGGPNR